jgi:hypothetical protein
MDGMLLGIAEPALCKVFQELYFCHDDALLCFFLRAL